MEGFTEQLRPRFYVRPYDDGPVPAADLLAIRLLVVAGTPLADATRCNVIGPSDGGASDCDLADAFVLDRYLGGGTVTVGDLCEAYRFSE